MDSPNYELTQNSKVAEVERALSSMSIDEPCKTGTHEQSDSAEGSLLFEKYSDEEDEPEPTWGKSKWDTSEDKMNKLDGLNKKKKSDGDDDKALAPHSMESWLQAHLPDDYSIRREPTPGKKRVRWADIEERREQERAREIGFVVGHTNWNRLTDPTFGDSALTKTKFI